jgi:SAM-dependent methyltransferase
VSHDHFDLVAGAYDESLPGHVREHYRVKRLRFIERLLARGSVLDVGCGTGELTGAIAARGYRVVGLDRSHGMLEVFRGRAGRRVVQGSSDALPFRSESFDLVVTIATLHHVGGPDTVRAMLGDLVRVARSPGGVVVVWDHNPRNPYWPSLMKRLPQDADGYRLVPLHEILDGLGRAGIRRTRVVRSGWVPDFVPRPLLPVFRSLEWLLERLPVIRSFGAHNVVVGVRERDASRDVAR